MIIAEVTAARTIISPAIDPIAATIWPIGCFASCDAANVRTTIDPTTIVDTAAISNICFIAVFPVLAVDATFIIAPTIMPNTTIRPAIDPAAAVILSIGSWAISIIESERTLIAAHIVIILAIIARIFGRPVTFPIPFVELFII